ncbi:TonB-dependent receptor plug domain-containing protein [Psychrobacter sp. A3]|uniref:TonB-dependent receptor plug domain-containing protein n=1 Tax=Psychrobacter sp. A3 TaxID=2992754 RepID=UPI00237B5FC2|nr:TonB-dependent receptor plug domain-containing protein [Psychrobacter sp. A3]MDE0490909.1 TonB-dependent receptor plug domain-containing protein [Psychrobacter sp. A3]
MLALRTPLSFAVKTLMFGSLATLSTVAFSASDSTDPSNEDVPTTTLDTITVTASSGGVTPTVNQQIIEKSTILDMKDVLKDQPSLSVSGGNGVAQQLYIRNMGENELTFSVDNVSTSAQVFHHQSRFMFDPALLKSINIEKGTGAASSGIGVTAGAIRMTTVNANDMLEADKDVGAMIGGGLWTQFKRCS